MNKTICALVSTQLIAVLKATVLIDVKFLVVGKGLVACLAVAPPGGLEHRFALLLLSGSLML